MAPARNLTNEDCFKLFKQIQTTEPFNTSGTNSSNSTPSGPDSELEALLYIVVTLLFYSLGIIIGIVTYLKREKQEMEEDKIYDEFLSMQHDGFTNSRFKKVQQVIKTLEFLQTRQTMKSECKKKIINELPNAHAQVDSIYEMASNPKSLSFSSDREDKVNSDEEEFDEPLSALVAKLIDPDKHRTLDYESNPGSSTRKKSSSSNPGSPQKESGIHESGSMQSLKEYSEEPRRTERSSLSSNDDVTDICRGDNDDNETTKLTGAKDIKGKKDIDINKDVKSGASGSCVVTNV